jgi:UDP-2,4-diacetamido-2,4,6-trideoxy-beta-L-altropyranose hydrolase
MKVAFRADASLEIGTGHVMRCLTLARALRERGHACLFISREHAGNLLKLISEEGFVVHALPAGSEFDSELVHAKWLGASQAEDALACKGVLESWCPDWLVVDHYALDHRWEISVRPVGCRVLVIDDLADRQHSCDVLLDQTFGRSTTDYTSKVPSSAKLLCGAQYALLRSEFLEWRNYSLERRNTARLKNILISMGGIDKENATEKVLDALRKCPLPRDCRITVVMGRMAPWLSEVEEKARQMAWPTSVKADINNMAEIMAESDLAIGAAGATIWERSCLGLPTIMMILADNQRYAAQVLEKADVARVLSFSECFSAELISEISCINACPDILSTLSTNSSTIVDGRGCVRVLLQMSA